MSERKVYICRKCMRRCRLEFNDEYLLGEFINTCPFGWGIPDWKEVSENTVDNRVAIKTGTVGLLINMLVNKINELNNEIAKYKTVNCKEVSEE